MTAALIAVIESFDRLMMVSCSALTLDQHAEPEYSLAVNGTLL